MTAIETQVRAYHDDFKTYKFIRKYLQAQAADWDNLIDEDKFLICTYKATTEERCKAILADEFDYYMTMFDAKSIKCREWLLASAKTVIIKNIDNPSRFLVLQQLDAMPSLQKNYIDHGVEGTCNPTDVTDGLVDWMEGTSSFTGAGLPALNLAMLGTITKAEMISQATNIIKTCDVTNYE